VLWLIWRDNTDKVPRKARDIPANARARPCFQRHLDDIFRMAVYLSVAERILASRTITIADVRRGQRYLQRFCEIAIRLKIHLKPNHHLAMHYEVIFRRFGPVYAWWLFAFERYNGLLEQVNLNGHASGEMELTLLRHWILGNG